MKKAGYSLLQIAAYLIMAGGISDILMPSFISSLPQAHLHYLNVAGGAVPIALKNLDAALIRAVGGCLIGISVGALTMIYTVLRYSHRAILGLLTMVTIGEGMNTIQMLWIHSSYFFFPLACVVIMWMGAGLWWFGK